MEVIDPGPSTYHHKRKRVNAACFVPSSKTLEAGVEREGSLDGSTGNGVMYRGVSEEGENGVWRPGQPLPVERADRPVRTVSTSSATPASSGPEPPLLAVHGEEGDHTDESCSNSSHGGDEGEARSESEACKSRLVGMVHTVGSEMESRMQTMGTRLACMERRLRCIGNGAYEASGANGQLQQNTCAVVWRKTQEMDQQIVGLFREVDRRLSMHSVRLNRLSNAWCRFTNTARAGNLSLSRELAFLRGEVESQGSTIQKLMWQLAARDAEINYLRSKLAEAKAAEGGARTEEGSTATTATTTTAAAKTTQGGQPAVPPTEATMS